MSDRMPEWSFGGIKIYQDANAVKQGDPVKVYPKHKAKTAAHYRRMNKKWLKRYGRKKIPCMFKMRGGLFGSNETVIVVHPSLYAQVREALRP